MPKLLILIACGEEFCEECHLKRPCSIGYYCALFKSTLNWNGAYHRRLPECLTTQRKAEELNRSEVSNQLPGKII